MIDRHSLIKNLTNIQRSLCAYDAYPGQSLGAPDFCDCKYGAHLVGSHSESGNGCPEVRQAVALLEVLTEKEYEELVRRVAGASARARPKQTGSTTAKSVRKAIVVASKMRANHRNDKGGDQ